MSQNNDDTGMTREGLAADNSADGQPPGVQDEALYRRTVQIEFAGTGSEYFRIWIVNVLLIIGTVGLYWPFAKARRLRYMHGNTFIDGHALGFHGDPWKMFRGFLLVAAMAFVYGASSRSLAGAVVAPILIGLLWPALWRASLQFRLANTSWRGLRFQFMGSLSNAYRAMLPLVLPWLLMIVTAAFLNNTHEMGDTVSAGMMTSYAVSSIVFGLMLPYGFYCIKNYQHSNYGYAQEQTRFLQGAKPFYVVGLKVFGLVLLMLLMLGAVLGGLFALGNAPGVLGFVLSLSYLVALSVVAAFFQTRLQNLVWSATETESVKLNSDLEFRKYFGLTLRNWLLTALSLGLYRPFAVIAAAKMRLEAIQIDLPANIDDWVSAGASMQDASGEAAGDFFGVDVGL